MNRILRSVLAGAAGGLAGTVSMDMVSAGWTLARRGKLTDPDESLIHHGARPDVDEAKRKRRHPGDGDAVASTRIGAAAGRRILGRGLHARERDLAGRITHYAFGACVGSLYGVLAARHRQMRAGRGSLFGLALWAGAVEVAMPLAGLTRKPWEYSPAQHAFGAVAHVAYGVVLEQTRAVFVRA